MEIVKGMDFDEEIVKIRMQRRMAMLRMIF